MGKEKSSKIAAVVVTYNRKELLCVCLDALLKQTCPLNALYIIDNSSTDGTPEYLMSKGFIDNPLYPDRCPLEETKTIPLPQNPNKAIEVHYVRMHENTGGAGGFHEGVKRAYQGYEWLWLMDDDVKADKQCLENLVDTRKLIEDTTHKATAALSCARFDCDDKPCCGEHKKINESTPFIKRHKHYVDTRDLDKDFLSMQAVTFEGMFVDTIYIRKIGFPDKRFFILGDDFDYSLRLLRFGNIYHVPSAKLVRLVRQQKNDGKYTWKSYYEIRNVLYMDLRYTSFPKKIVIIAFKLLKLMVGRLYHHDIKGMYTIPRSLLDAIKMYREKHNDFD